MFVSDESINQINQVVVERELFLCVFTSQVSLMRSQMSSGSSFSLYGISRVPFLSRFRRSPYLHADSHARTHARTQEKNVGVYQRARRWHHVISSLPKTSSQAQGRRRHLRSFALFFFHFVVECERKFS